MNRLTSKKSREQALRLFIAATPSADEFRGSLSRMKFNPDEVFREVEAIKLDLLRELSELTLDESES